ncbi:hypothetical protein [Altericroceibacterium endophyticum]|uniref:Uncharacterized protein n=1 Tax=Altericroceibacterium endophyticum TaxID=1808508 RepID=A0A6I4T0S9_9SPHN|nr:hypothetical protein [Altericroceibacterium endophyticum]MXO64547.1 hypothetical protein [Altericroceibacterium endophyticum]
MIQQARALIQLGDDGCCDADIGRESVGASIIVGLDAAPVLELSDHILDLVPLVLDYGIVLDLNLPICS